MITVIPEKYTYTTVFKIEDKDSMFISNVGSLLPAYTVIRAQEIVSNPITGLDRS
jgi:hypothetical protein